MEQIYRQNSILITGDIKGCRKDKAADWIYISALSLIKC